MQPECRPQRGALGLQGRPRLNSRVGRASAGLRVRAAASLQLASARLPASVDKAAFGSNLYQWASSLTSSGQNMPFVLPLMCDKTRDGFKISLISITDAGRPVSVGDIVASVEKSEQDDVLFVRYFEGPGFVEEFGTGRALPQDEKERLKLSLSRLQDVPVIMRTMPAAIKRAVASSS